MLVRFNKRTIIGGTIYSPEDGDVDIANDLADQVVAEGNGRVVGLGERSNEVSLSTDANNNTVLVGADGEPIFSEIALWGVDEYVAGVAQETGQIIPSSTINNAAVGSALTWTTVLFDTTVGGVWSAANPSRIVIPAGVKKAWLSGSVMFPPNATGARWIRLTTGATTAHMSNTLQPVSHGVASQTVQLSTGWIDVVAGDYYELRAVQDSGSSLTLSLGTLANKGGSNYLRVAFKK